MLTDQSLKDLLDAFSSPEPTPGGGSAAALCGALGASLLAMVAGLPKTKTGAPEERAALDAARADLLAQRDHLVDLVDRDAASYDLVVAAYRRPKATDVDKTLRMSAIQDALRTATSVPLETWRACMTILLAARAVAAHGNPSARSDLMMGLQATMIGQQGAWWNIEANLGGLTDQSFAASVIEEVRAQTASMRGVVVEIYQSANLIEMLKESAKRLDIDHGRPPA